MRTKFNLNKEKDDKQLTVSFWGELILESETHRISYQIFDLNPAKKDEVLSDIKEAIFRDLKNSLYGDIDKLVRLAVTLEMIHNGTADYGEETKGYALELITQIANQLRHLQRKSERIGR